MLTGPIREVTPGPDDVMEENKVEAYQLYDTLIALGGRPSRQIREQPVWETTLVNGIVYYTDPHDRRLGGSVEEEYYIHSHGDEEWTRCEEELERWQEFRVFQQRLVQLARRETDLDLETPDQKLVETLTKISDWQDFQ